MNYFELLSLSIAFNIDPAALEKAYFAEQRKYHPDRFTTKPDNERQAAIHRSIDINNAYHTLKHPLARAQYLLKLQGIRVGSNADTVKPSHNLLIEVMQWREAAEESAQNQLENLQKELKEQERQSVSRVAELYKAQAWQELAQETLRLGYIVKTLEELRDAKRL